MKNVSLFLLSAILSFGAFFAGASCDSHPAPIAPVVVISQEELIKKEIVNSTVLILTDHGSGTGVVVYQDKKHAYILTANHVVFGGIHYFGRQALDNRIEYEELKLVFWDAETDHALLESSPKWAGAANLIAADSDIILYSKAFTFGFPGTITGPVNGVLTEGRISALHDMSMDIKETTITSVPASFGNSGGGLFIFKNGHYRLCGIAHCMGCVRGMGNVYILPHITGFSTGEQLLTFLEAFQKRK